MSDDLRTLAEASPTLKRDGRFGAMYNLPPVSASGFRADPALLDFLCACSPDRILALLDELDALRLEHEAHRKWWDATGMRPDLLDAFRAAHDAAEKVMRP